MTRKTDEEIRAENVIPVVDNTIPLIVFSGPNSHASPRLTLTTPGGQVVQYVYGAGDEVFAVHDGTGWGAFVLLDEPGEWSYEWTETGTDKPQRGRVLVN